METDFVPHLKSNLTQSRRVFVPKIFQRILQFTGQKKLPDFDQICSLFTTYLNPEKTTELIKMKMGNIAKQLTNTATEDSPPRRRRKKAGEGEGEELTSSSSGEENGEASDLC